MQGQPTNASVSWTSSNILSCRIEATAQYFSLTSSQSSMITSMQDLILTEWAPERLIIGASRLLVRFTVLISPFWRSSVEDMAIWVVGGSFERALLTRAPPGGGDAVRFDIVERDRAWLSCEKSKFLIRRSPFPVVRIATKDTKKQIFFVPQTKFESALEVRLTAKFIGYQSMIAPR